MLFPAIEPAPAVARPMFQFFDCCFGSTIPQRLGLHPRYPFQFFDCCFCTVLFGLILVVPCYSSSRSYLPLSPRVLWCPWRSFMSPRNGHAGWSLSSRNPLNALLFLKALFHFPWTWNRWGGPSAMVPSPRSGLVKALRRRSTTGEVEGVVYFGNWKSLFVS